MTTFLHSILPEIFFAFSIYGQVLFNTRFMVYNEQFTRSTNAKFGSIDREVFIQMVFILSCVLLLLLNNQVEAVLVNFPFYSDSNGFLLKMILIIATFIILPLIWRSFLLRKLDLVKHYVIFSCSLCGSLILLSTNNLGFSFLLLELVTLGFFTLAVAKNNRQFSIEDGVRYFRLNGWVLLAYFLGIFLIYVATISTNINALTYKLRFMFDLLSAVTPFYAAAWSLADKALHIVAGFYTGVSLVILVILYKIFTSPSAFWSSKIHMECPKEDLTVLTLLPKLVIASFWGKWIMSFLKYQIDLIFVLSVIGLFLLIMCGYFAVLLKR